jgi:hypothetical protein
MTPKAVQLIAKYDRSWTASDLVAEAGRVFRLRKLLQETGMTIDFRTMDEVYDYLLARARALARLYPGEIN